MSTKLPEFFIEKAKNELGESESRKNDSLLRVKEWLAKHPFIKYDPGKCVGKIVKKFFYNCE